MSKHVDFTKQSPIILSVCPGIRGIERGLERIFRSVSVAAYVEIETFIVENLLTAMEAGLVGPAPIWTDLKTFNPSPFRNRIDGIIGGYPCQPFSLAGNRKGVEDPRHLWPYILKIICTVRPVFCFFENVSGHLSMGYPEVYRSLRDSGYRVECGIYTAEEVGAPQERKRLFILAILEDSFGNRPRRDDRGRFLGKTVRASQELGYTGHEFVEGGSLGNWSDQKGREISNGSASKSSRPCELGDSKSSSRKWEYYQPGGEQNRRSGDALADSNDESRGLSKSEGRREGSEIERLGIELADSNNNGSNFSQNGQGNSEGSDGGSSREIQLFESARCGDTRNDDRFPAGQGNFQYEWEEPRTIESSLVYTIDGYNFAEDLHRAIGNSVVEQTAELAFRDLLRKHFK